MQLFGRFLSPYTRLVSMVLNHHGIEHEHHQLAVANDADREEILRHNSLGRVPILRINEQDALVESDLIILHLEQNLADEARLFPRDGRETISFLTHHGRARGIMDRAVAAFYESSRRPEDKRWPEHAEKLDLTWQATLGEFEQSCPAPGQYFLGGKLSLIDLDMAVIMEFLAIARAKKLASMDLPKLHAWMENMAQHQLVKNTRPN